MTSQILPQSMIPEAHCCEPAEPESIGPDTLAAQYTLKELKEMCKERGISYAGSKKEIVQRLTSLEGSAPDEPGAVDIQLTS